MSQHSRGGGWRQPLVAAWPDLLLVALAAATLAWSRGSGPAEPLLEFGVWLAAASVVIVRTLRGRAADAGWAPGRDRRLIALAVLGVPALSGLAAEVLGVHELVAPGAPVRVGAQAVALTVAAARLRAWEPPPVLAPLATVLAPSVAFAVLAAALELGREPLRGGAWAAPALLLLLAVVAAAAFRRERRERDELRANVEDLRRLRSEAEYLRARGDDPRELDADGITRRARTTRIMGAVVDLDSDLERILGLAALALGARSVVLFLLEGDGEQLRVRRAGGPGAAGVDREAAPRLGEGVVGHAALTRRPALFTNLDPGSLLPPLYGAATPSPSLVIVPVSETGVFRGVLVADAAAPGAFGSEQERILDGFAVHVGALLESARSDVSRANHSHRMEALVAVTQALSSTIKIEEVLRKTVERLQKAIPYDRCALFLVDRADRSLVLREQRGFDSGDGEPVRLPFDYGLPGYIATHDNTLLFSNLKQRKRGLEIVPGAAGIERIRSLLGVPVHNQAELVGIWVFVAEEPGRFDSGHLDILSIVAAQAAALIANAELHEAVERMAVTDGLTGLFNHRELQQRLEDELARADRKRAPLSLMLLDIDHFKKINDTYGHPFGDQVLKALAATLRRLARRVDVVARYGGEEFAFLLFNTDRRGARAGARRVLDAVHALQVARDDGPFGFTLSIGTATFPDDARTREQLVREADRALYAAKRSGRDRAVAVHDLPEEPARGGVDEPAGARPA